MIEARKSPLFNRWFARHAQKRITRTFSAVYVQGLGPVLETVSSHPILLVANHSSWWDALVAVYLGNRVLGTDGYAMMDASVLRKLPFFGKVGAFGVDQKASGTGRQSIRYAVSLLDGPGKMVLVFPQGLERPVTERPLGFRHGSAVIAVETPDVQIVPLAIRYEMAHLERPFLYLSFGRPRPSEPSVEAELARQEADVTEELDRIDGHLLGLTDREEKTGSLFAPLIVCRRRRLAHVAEWVLARLFRPRVRDLWRVMDKPLITKGTKGYQRPDERRKPCRS